jgi:hypothetical protein
MQDSRVSIPAVFLIAAPLVVALPPLKWRRLMRTVPPVIDKSWLVALAAKPLWVRVDPFPSITMLFVISGRGVAKIII